MVVFWRSYTEYKIIMDEADLKLQFAKELLFKENSFEAALVVFAGDTKKALSVHEKWSLDPIVISEKQRLSDETNPDDYLPTRTEYARKIWNSVDQCRTEDGKVKMLRLYGEVRGYLEKPGSAFTQNNVVQNKVMIIQHNGSDSDWKRKLKSQQEKLING